MQIKIDECLPLDIARLLIGYGYEVETMKEEGLVGYPDDLVWQAVQREKFFLITADLDFSDIRQYKPGTHHGILLLRLSKEGKNHIISYFIRLISDFDLNDWIGCLVIATDHKIRIKKPHDEISEP